MGLSILKPKWKKKNVNAFGEDLDHLSKDGELPWGWLVQNKDFVQKIEAEKKFFTDAWLKTKSGDLKAQYAALKSLIKYMEDAQKLCADKGECFAKWASEYVADPVELKMRKEDLQKIENRFK